MIIFGCGGHARSVINVIREKNKEEEIILIDENAKDGEMILGCKAERKYTVKKDDRYIVAIGSNTDRKKKYDDCIQRGIGCSVSVVSAYAYIGIDSTIGEGTFIAPNASIGPLAEIGTNTIINTGSVIEHETKIGNNTHIGPNVTICGRANIGNNVFCGAGSVVADGITICDNVILGAGCVVVNNIDAAGTYVGVPAKQVKRDD